MGFLQEHQLIIMKVTTLLKHNYPYLRGVWFFSVQTFNLLVFPRHDPHAIRIFKTQQLFSVPVNYDCNYVPSLYHRSSFLAPVFFLVQGGDRTISSRCSECLQGSFFSSSRSPNYFRGPVNYERNYVSNLYHPHYSWRQFFFRLGGIFQRIFLVTFFKSQFHPREDNNS